MRLTNNRNQLQMLEDGTCLPASGTIEVEELSDSDRKRLVESGIVTAVEDEKQETTPTFESSAEINEKESHPADVQAVSEPASATPAAPSAVQASTVIPAGTQVLPRKERK